MESLTVLRRLLLAGVVAASVLSIGASAQAESGSLNVVSVDTSGPQVAAVVAPDASLAGRDLTGARWTVSEGGRSVGVRVEQVSNANLEVVLALDTSGSMAGAPMDAAKAAAEAFVTGLPASARVAIVSFSSRPTVVVPLTAERSTLVEAIRALRAQGETALYDAVQTAAGLFSPAREARREFVLLSDGADTVSKTDQAGAIAALTGAHATGYVASLVTKDTAAGVLNDIAGRTGGRVVSATDVAAIRSTFGNIGAVLTNQYRLTFRSLSTGQTDVTFSVSLAGVSATADRVIDLPLRRTSTSLPPAQVAVAPDDGWMKTAGLASAAVGMLVLGLMLFARPGRRRITSSWITAHAATTRDSGLHDLTHRASEIAERSLQRRGWSERLDEALERAGLPIRPGEFALVVICIVGASFVVGAALFGPFLGVGAAVGAGFLTRTVVRFKIGRRRVAFESQLAETLALLSGSLRAGYGLVQALDAVAKNSESPTADEFNRLIMEMRVGRNVAEALNAVAMRMQSDDFSWVVEAIGINREVGGDLTELLDRAGETIRERENVRRQIKSLSAEGRLSAVVLVSVPIFLFFYMRLVNPSYIGLLTSSPIGWIMFSVAIGGIVLGALWLRNLVKVVF
jgi:tight adherence protein B